MTHAEMRALYADPVPPAGGEPEAPKRLPVRAPEGRNLPAGYAKAWNDACTAWEACVAKLIKAGVEVEAKTSGRAIAPVGCRYRKIDRVDRAWTYREGVVKTPWHGYSVETLYTHDDVTRLQAEVERLKSTCQGFVNLHAKAQSELTKARECLKDIRQSCELSKLRDAQIDAILSNQSAPADKGQV